MSDLPSSPPSGPSRRVAIKAFVGLGLASGLTDCAPAQELSGPSAPGPSGGAPPAEAAPDPTSPVSAAGQPIAEHTHPAAGDRLVFAFGDREGRPITPDDVPLGGPLITAHPADANGGHVANASRLDQVILLRVDPSTLSEETRARSAEGIVAYSGICTHTGCEVTDWDGVTGRLICPCHDSHFDPADNATVLEGPAPRRLAALPVEIVGGDLRVAGGFVGRLGAQRSGQTSS